MTHKRHSRLVSTLGNGGHVANIIVRSVITLGTAAIIGGVALIWDTSQHLQAVAQDLKGLRSEIGQFVEAQNVRDSHQDARMQRLDERIRQIERSGWVQ